MLASKCPSSLSLLVAAGNSAATTTTATSTMQSQWRRIVSQSVSSTQGSWLASTTTATTRRQHSTSRTSAQEALRTPWLSSTVTSSARPTLSSSSSSTTPLTPSSTSSSVRGYSSTPVTAQQPAEMRDEYGAMDDSGDTYTYPGDYVLESGAVLPNAQLRYQTYGTLNETRDNVIVICHALTGNASLHSWWGGLLGPGLAFDTDQYFVVCCNILGSCYGSTSATSTNPATGEAYGLDFPDVSVQDNVRLQLLMLQNDLRVRSVKSVIGGSFGGMQTLEYAVQAGSSKRADFLDDEGKPFVRTVVPIACGAAHTAWQIGISEVQRQAIYKDPQFGPTGGREATAGLEVARQIGMISYRTAQGYIKKFDRRLQGEGSPEYGSSAKWQVKSYLEYQGKKFLDRFDPVTYIKLTEQMDSHDVARGRNAESTADVLKDVDIPALVMGITSDVLYPLSEQEYLAQHMPKSVFKVIKGDDGHDGFLLEQDQVGGHIIDFLNEHD